MVQDLSISASKREDRGSRSSRRLRAQGRIPGILYGHGEEPLQISVDTTELRTILRKGGHGLWSLSIDDRKESAVIKELQYDHLGIEIFHIDFARVSADERISTTVPIHLKGSAAGAKGGGVVDQPMHEIEIECLASNLIEHIVVNISDLDLGKEITVADLKLPEGAKALADPEQIVVHVIKPAAEPEEGSLLGEPSATEPEVIRREKEAEESEE